MSLPLVSQPEQITDARLATLKIVDLRSIDEYQLGHIPGALHLPADLLNRKEGQTGGLLPDAVGADNLAQAIGLNDGDTVLAYDAGGASTAARLIWVLHAYGFHSITMLNGGFNAWVTNKRVVSTDEATQVSKSDAVLTLTPGNRLTVDQILMETLERFEFLDVRSRAEFDGSDVRAARGGHVPNAIHSEWTTVFDENGALKDDDTLRAMMSAMAIKKEKHVVVYCQTHQRSAMTYVVLKHLGFDRVSAIDGAWSAWGNRDDTPVA